MKKITILFIVCAALCSCGANTEDSSVSDRLRNMRSASVIPVDADTENIPQDNGYSPVNYDIQKGIWLSYIDLAPMLNTDDASVFRERFETVCENISGVGFNTVYIHVRPFGDALYSSELYPASAYVPQTDGEILFDPLEIMCDTAHEYGLSVHGWINPLRCQTADELERTDRKYLTAQWFSQDSEIIRQVDGDTHLWLNPAYSEVRELIAGGAAEIAENYPVDGIHYDDYFYPTTETSFDSQCYAAMSQGESLENFRTENISSMCRQIYSEVKNIDSRIQVGISPQGNIENNYVYMYADVKEWCSSTGYADCIIPQIYFGYNNAVQPFSQVLKDWAELAEDGNVKLIAGLGAYKIGEEDEFSSDTGIIASQISDAAADGFSGSAVYSYGTLFPEDDSERISNERECIRAAFGLADGGKHDRKM